jgi:hypothetical protein
LRDKQEVKELELAFYNLSVIRDMLQYFGHMKGLYEMRIPRRAFRIKT